MGHVIKAKRVKAWDEDTTGYSVDSWFHGTYGYQVDGKSYEYRYMSKVYPPVSYTHLDVYKRQIQACKGREYRRTSYAF